MVKLHYGNGECYVAGAEDIRGIQIFYSGAVEIDDKTPSGYEIVFNDRQILIFPVNPTMSLSNLFSYNGVFKIKSAIIANANAEEVPKIIKKDMDMAELMTSKAEDITLKSEELNKGHIYGKKQGKSSVKTKIITNLHTDDLNAPVLYEDGKRYSGYYHIHKEDGGCMTGKEHTKLSKNLFFSQGDELLPTKNPSHVPQQLLKKEKKISSNKRRKQTINTRSISKY